MSDWNPSDEFRAMVASMSQEAWTITGTDSNGHFWLSRLRIGGDESRPLTDEQLRRIRQTEVDRMNSLGSSVRLVRERIGEDLCWHEVEVREGAE